MKNPFGLDVRLTWTPPSTGEAHMGLSFDHSRTLTPPGVELLVNYEIRHDLFVGAGAGYHYSSFRAPYAAPSEISSHNINPKVRGSWFPFLTTSSSPAAYEYIVVELTLAAAISKLFTAQAEPCTDPTGRTCEDNVGVRLGNDPVYTQLDEPVTFQGIHLEGAAGMGPVVLQYGGRIIAGGKLDERTFKIDFVIHGPNGWLNLESAEEDPVYGITPGTTTAGTSTPVVITGLPADLAKIAAINITADGRNMGHPQAVAGGGQGFTINQPFAQTKTISIDGQEFTFTVTPTLGSVTPTRITTGGGTLTITGTGFAGSGEGDGKNVVTVTGSSEETFEVVATSNTEITVEIPAAFATANAGQSLNISIAVNDIPAPGSRQVTVGTTVMNITEGPALGENNNSVSGLTDGETVTVLINSIPLPSQIVAASQVTFIMPRSNTSGPVEVIVQASGVGGAELYKGNYTYLPVLSSVDNPNIPLTGRTLQLTGAGFIVGNTTVEIEFADGSTKPFPGTVDPANSTHLTFSLDSAEIETWDQATTQIKVSVERDGNSYETSSLGLGLERPKILAAKNIGADAGNPADDHPDANIHHPGEHVELFMIGLLDTSGAEAVKIQYGGTDYDVTYQRATSLPAGVTAPAGLKVYSAILQLPAAVPPSGTAQAQVIHKRGNSDAFSMPMDVSTGIGTLASRGGFDVVERSGVFAAIANLEFEAGSATLTRRDQATIRKIADWLQAIKDTGRDMSRDTLEIGGHTSHTGKKVGNQSLSETRATLAQHELKQVLRRNGISINITVVGYGETQPLESTPGVDEDTPDATIHSLLGISGKSRNAKADNTSSFKRNRRVEFKYIEGS